MTRTDRILESLHFTFVKLENPKSEKEFRREIRRAYSLQYRLDNSIKN